MRRKSVSPQKAVLDILAGLGRSRRLDDHFEAAMEALYLSTCLSTNTTIGRERLEDRLAKVLSPYDEGGRRAIQSLQEIISSEMADGHQDFLGGVAGELAALNRALGQYFSPYDLCSLTAQITLSGVETTHREKGYVTLCEPASGSGAMLIACVDVLEGRQIDIRRDILIDASDLSSLAYWMTFLQLSARGVPAIVRRRNSLTLEQFEQQFTPDFPSFWNRHGAAFQAEQRCT